MFGTKYSRRKLVIVVWAVLIQFVFAQVAFGNDLGQIEKKTRERIEHSLRELDSNLNVGEKAAKFIEQEGRKRSSLRIAGKSYKEVPSEHPFLANDGADSAGKSSREYGQKDSKEVILNDETFAGCFEERKVVDPVYTSGCEGNCPKWVYPTPGCPSCIPGSPGCLENKSYVSESYFPVYQVRLFPGRAMGSFDVQGTYLSGADKRSELGLQQTKQRVESEVKPLVLKILERLGIPEPDKIFPDGYDPNVEWYGHDSWQANDSSQPYTFHALTYQTNLHRVATRTRPKEFWLGYELEDKCFFHTLDDPTKEVIGNASYGDQEYLLASMFAKETEKIEPKGAKATILPGSTNFRQVAQLLKAENGQLPKELQGLTPSQRMSEWDWMAPAFRRLGIRPEKLERDYNFYGHTLAPFSSSNYNSNVDPVYAAISQGISHFYLNGLKKVSANTKRRRSLMLTRYTARESKSKPGYTGDDATVKDPIVHTDKVQLIYPPIEDGGNRKGTHCFRPENLSKLEPPRKEGDLARRIAKKTDSGHFSIPIDLRKRFPNVGMEGLNYGNEVRLTFYTKQVKCFCEHCGVVSGCLTLNNGDLETDSFYGTKPYTGGASLRKISDSSSWFSRNSSGSNNGDRVAKGNSLGFSPAVEKALPYLKAAAANTSPLSPSGAISPPNTPSADLGTPGKLSGVQPPEVPTPPELPEEPLVCEVCNCDEGGQTERNFVFRQFLQKEKTQETGFFVAKQVGQAVKCKDGDCSFESDFKVQSTQRFSDKDELQSLRVCEESKKGEYQCRPVYNKIRQSRLGSVQRNPLEFCQELWDITNKAPPEIPKDEEVPEELKDEWQKKKDAREAFDKTIAEEVKKGNFTPDAASDIGKMADITEGQFFDRFGVNGDSIGQISQMYDSLGTLASNPSHLANLPGGSPQSLVTNYFAATASPGLANISQGAHPTCGLCAGQHHILSDSPGSGASFINSVLFDQSFTSPFNGKTYNIPKSISSYGFGTEPTVSQPGANALSSIDHLIQTAGSFMVTGTKFAGQGTFNSGTSFAQIDEFVHAVSGKHPKTEGNGDGTETEIAHRPNHWIAVTSTCNGKCYANSHGIGSVLYNFVGEDGKAYQVSGGNTTSIPRPVADVGSFGAGGGGGLLQGLGGGGGIGQIISSVLGAALGGGGGSGGKDGSTNQKPNGDDDPCESIDPKKPDAKRLLAECQKNLQLPKNNEVFTRF